MVKNLSTMQATWVRSLGWEDLQHSGLENSMDRRACQAAVRGVTKSWIRLNDFHFQKLTVRQLIPNSATDASFTMNYM